jgi:signal transduction histidine kinase
MEHMIHDLLDLGSIQAGHLSVAPRTHDAVVLVREAIDTLGPLAASRSLRLDARVPDVPVWVSCDRDRIQQLFSNLVGNAIKFTPPGGAITIDAVGRDGGAELAVVDTGPGIRADQLGRIFERYWQAGETRRDGIGLGLAIAKGIVEAHGGRIWAESPPGAGCSIRFTLPVAPTP